MNDTKIILTLLRDKIDSLADSQISMINKAHKELQEYTDNKDMTSLAWFQSSSDRIGDAIALQVEHAKARKEILHQLSYKIYELLREEK